MKRLFGSAAVVLALAGLASADIPPPTPADIAEGLSEPNNRETPEVFVQSVYKTKLDAEAISSDLGRNTTSHIVLYYFTPELLALYKQAMEFNDGPIVDADMFMMAQDWDTKSDQVALKVLSQDDAAASVEATLQSFGAKHIVVVSVKKSKAGLWRIDDVTDPANGAGIRQMIGVGLAERGVTP